MELFEAKCPNPACGSSRNLTLGIVQYRISVTCAACDSWWWPGEVEHFGLFFPQVAPAKPLPRKVCAMCGKLEPKRYGYCDKCYDAWYGEDAKPSRCYECNSGGLPVNGLHRFTDGTETRNQQCLNQCHSDNDGDCRWVSCPQLRDKEPDRSGRHCPLDV